MSRADAGARNSEYITGRTASATSSESSEEIARPRRIHVAGEYNYNYETTSRASRDAPGVAGRAGGVAATADGPRRRVRDPVCGDEELRDSSFYAPA